MKFGRFVFVVFGAMLFLSACGSSGTPTAAVKAPPATTPTGANPQQNGYQGQYASGNSGCDPGTYPVQANSNSIMCCTQDGSYCTIDVYVDNGSCNSGCDSSGYYYSLKTGLWQVKSASPRASASAN